MSPRCDGVDHGVAGGDVTKKGQTQRERETKRGWFVRESLTVDSGTDVTKKGQTERESESERERERERERARERERGRERESGERESGEREGERGVFGCHSRLIPARMYAAHDDDACGSRPSL